MPSASSREWVRISSMLTTSRRKPRFSIKTMSPRYDLASSSVGSRNSVASLILSLTASSRSWFVLSAMVAQGGSVCELSDLGQSCKKGLKRGLQERKVAFMRHVKYAHLYSTVKAL